MSKQHAPRFLSLVNEAKSHVKECSVLDLKAKMDRHESFALVDVREESEFAAGHIPGAMHLSKGIIERDIETKFPDTAKEILLYCGGGFRSALTADNLQRMGYTNVVSVDGGWRAWTESGFATQIPSN